MADKIDISATVRAIDQASGPLKSIANQIKSVGDVAKTAGGSLARLATQPFGGLGQNLRGVGSAVKGLAGNFKALWSPLGALIGVGGFAGAVAAVKEYVSELRNLGRVSRRTGASIGTIQGLSLMTGDAEKASNSLTMLTRGLAKLATAKKPDPRIVEILGKMGISLADVRSGAITTDQVLAKLAAGFAKNTQNISSMNWVAQQLAGKAGKDLVDILARGPEELQRWVTEAAKRIQVDDAMLERAGNLRKAQELLGASIKGLRIAVIDALQPALLAGTEWLDKFIIAHKPQIVMTLSEAIKTLGRWMGYLWKGIETVVGVMGGWEAAAGTLGAIFAWKLLPDVLKLTGALAKLGASIVFNPITLGALGLAGAAAIVHRNWATVGPWLENNFGNLGRAAKVAFEAVGNWALKAKDDIIKGWKTGGLLGAVTAGVISAGKAIYNNWNEISQWLEGTFPGISAAAKTAWANIETWWKTSVQNIKTAWETGGLAAAMEATWEAAKIGATGMYQFIRDEADKINWNKVGTDIGNAIKSGAQAVVDFSGWLETLEWRTVGQNIGRFIASGIAALFGQSDTGSELRDAVILAFRGIGKASITIGWEIARGIAEGIFEEIQKVLPESIRNFLFGKAGALPVAPGYQAPVESLAKSLGEEDEVARKSLEQIAQQTRRGGYRPPKETLAQSLGFEEPPTPGPVPLAPTPTTPVGPNLLQGMKETPVRLDGEVMNRVKIDMSPDLRAMLTEIKSTNRLLKAQLDVGVSMGPAMGEAA